MIPEDRRSEMIVEVEVDTLEQLDLVLQVAPDIVLLDNMSLSQLVEAVARRNRVNPAVQLEASGGVNLQTVAAIASTGVDRISVGARRIRRCASMSAWTGCNRSGTSVLSAIACYRPQNFPDRNSHFNWNCFTKPPILVPVGLFIGPRRNNIVRYAFYLSVTVAILLSASPRLAKAQGALLGKEASVASLSRSAGKLSRAGRSLCRHPKPRRG